MRIVCPGCGFGREADEAKLSPSACIATCPHCGERFRFRDIGGEFPITSQDGASEDLPPPGSVVPKRKLDPEDEELFAHPRDVPPEDETERRRHAASAYRRIADLPPSREEEAFHNPWENLEDGWPAAFYQTVVRVLFAAPRFFAALAPRRALLRPLIFYLLVGLVQIFAERFWLMLFAEMSVAQVESDPQLAGMMSLLTMDMGLPMLVLVRSAVITLWLFLICALYHLMIRLVAPDRADFSLAFQVLAYASAPAVFSVVPALGAFVGFFWSVACSVIGCRYAFRLTWAQTVAVLAPLYLLAFLLVLKAFSGASRFIAAL